MDLKAQLQSDATAYCARAGISLPRLATIVVNDGKFFDRLAKGGDFTTGTHQKFETFFADHADPTPATATGG